ncbi:MAG: YbhB/YbcL family Raf kinase inhibitor-like protein [Candidatus Thorarchaeota archaeon]|nr:YbhB/YbcL family Raf kinase inhibitor-like protein [Candidatus Thorarchaeota archaeon]
MKLWSNDFENGSPIPDRCAYRRENKSPHLAWDEAPMETKSFALICNDPDAPVGDWIHWLVHSIPADAREIPTGGPVSGIEITNDFGTSGWGGPAPPSGTHRYFFTLYALDVPSLEGATKSNFKNLCETHKIATAQIMGTYSKR